MSKNIPESSAYRQNVIQTFQQRCYCTRLFVVSLLLNRACARRLSILQDTSKSDLQVEIDIGCAALHF